MTGVFAKTVRDHVRGLVAWSAGIVLLVIAMTALWPSVRDLPDLQEFLANYPEALRELFNISEITTGPGYLNAELFAIVVPAMFLVYAIGRGSRLVAGEERAGTLEAVLATPVSRGRILLEKALGLTVAVTVLASVLFAVTAAASAVAGMDAPLRDLGAACVAVALLGIEHGLLALAVGAATGRRGLAVAVAGAVAAAGYVVYVMGALVDAVAPWRGISPFDQALRGGPIGAPHAALGWLAAGAVASIAVALPLFGRRDIAA